VDEDSVSAIVDWSVHAALDGVDEAALLDGLCVRLLSAGLPLRRVAVGSGLLHPTLDSRGYRWTRGEPVVQEDYARSQVALEEWDKSPFRALVEGNERSLRRRLDGDYRHGEFEMLDRLKAEGATDYYARIEGSRSAPTSAGKMGASVSSWTIDRRGGYEDREIAQIDRISAAFALAYQSRALHGTVRTLMETYLGAGAARRVLDGNVERGRADAIDAVIWYSDLVNFTRIADEVEREQLLGLLNEYAAVQVEAVESHGGEVLKFVGDGILAIFPDPDPARAAGQALDAALAADAGIVALNRARRDSGLRTTEFYLALHTGSVLFGNFGSQTRLDFTVLGPAVNETSRIGAMCRSLDQQVIVSSAFAGAAGRRRADLVSLGRYALRGVGAPQELFTLDRGRIG
jgi:adenylate cyclase